MSSTKGVPKSLEHRAKLAAMLTAVNKSPEHIAKVKLALTGRPKSDSHRANLWANRSRVFTPEACANMAKARTGVVQSAEHRRKSALAKMGELNPMWKGGTKSESRMIYQRVEIRLWRESVFARDDHTCGLCLRRGGNLEAHHIRPFSTHKDLRFDVSNGMTVCKPCHDYITRTHRSVGIISKIPMPAPEGAEAR